MLQKLYHAFLRRLIDKTFPLYQGLGFHVTPNHFYQPIPDTGRLRHTLWTKHSELVGIDINEAKQLELLSLFAPSFKHEYDRFPRNRTATPYEYYVNNGTFESVDGEILYCMIRHLKPRIVLEIGSGYSTYLSAAAIRKNADEVTGYQCELTAIEPYPRKTLRRGFPGLSRLVSSEVQDVPLSEFGRLAENDILFIDSSHVLRIGNDVQYEYLEILPRLRKGVVVHIHDVFLPAEYPREWILRRHLFWTEQYLLQAFLSFNHRFEVLWAGSYMHLNHPDMLETAFTSYRRNERWPGSFWIRTTKQ
jgi:predicted O-methyltransferase YrrM